MALNNTQVSHLGQTVQPPKHSASNPAFQLPSVPNRFCGRDHLVCDIVQRLKRTSQARYAIMGPGGYGKTSLGIAVMNHAEVAAMYGSRIYWVSCEQAVSAARFLELVAGSFDVSITSKDLLAEVIAFLRSFNEPCLLFLDNFETPWDLSENLSEVCMSISAIARLPHVNLLVTMRGHKAPEIAGLQWSQPELPVLGALTLKSACELYTSSSGLTEMEETDRKHVEELMWA